MRLFEHEDFGPILTETTRWLQEKQGFERISTQIVEKDYYVTQVLRSVAMEFGDAVLFKGGTSLSKGWGLIQRFSEDVDLFLNPRKFDPVLGESRIRKKLEQMKDLVGKHPGLTWLRNNSEVDNKVRADVFGYKAQYEDDPDIPSEVLMEAGVRSGEYPNEQVALDSYVAEFLRERGLADITEDLEPFPMTLLHFRRTFVEKLYTIYSKVEIMIARDDPSLGNNARHYYDLVQLARRPEVQAMLRSPDEMAEIIDDYYAVTQKHFKKTPLPDDRRLCNSRAHFPDSSLMSSLAEAYAMQCDRLCYTRSYPTFDEVLGEFEMIREFI